MRRPRHRGSPSLNKLRDPDSNGILANNQITNTTVTLCGASPYYVPGEASGTWQNPVFPIDGNLKVKGTVSKLAGSFRIDDPLDPENKYLSHSFVESLDMMNVYNGGSRAI